MKAILVDIDHVVADAAWRDEHAGPGKWDEYHAMSERDKPFKDVIAMVNAMHSTNLFYAVGLTGRTEKWRKLTLSWLIQHDVMLDELIMRPDKDFRPAPIVKVELARARFPDLANQVAFVFDDREDILAAFKVAGVNGFLVYGTHSRHEQKGDAQ